MLNIINSYHNTDVGLAVTHWSLGTYRCDIPKVCHALDTSNSPETWLQPFTFTYIGMVDCFRLFIRL